MFPQPQRIMVSFCQNLWNAHHVPVTTLRTMSRALASDPVVWKGQQTRVSGHSYILISHHNCHRKENTLEMRPRAGLGGFCSQDMLLRWWPWGDTGLVAHGAGEAPCLLRQRGWTWTWRSVCVESKDEGREMGPEEDEGRTPGAAGPPVEQQHLQEWVTPSGGWSGHCAKKQRRQSGHRRPVRRAFPVSRHERVTAWTTTVVAMGRRGGDRCDFQLLTPVGCGGGWIGGRSGQPGWDKSCVVCGMRNVLSWRHFLEPPVELKHLPSSRQKCTWARPSVGFRQQPVTRIQREMWGETRRSSCPPPEPQPTLASLVLVMTSLCGMCCREGSEDLQSRWLWRPTEAKAAELPEAPFPIRSFSCSPTYLCMCESHLILTSYYIIQFNFTSDGLYVCLLFLIAIHVVEDRILLFNCLIPY